MEITGREENRSGAGRDSREWALTPRPGGEKHQIPEQPTEPGDLEEEEVQRIGAGWSPEK